MTKFTLETVPQNQLTEIVETINTNINSSINKNRGPFFTYIIGSNGTGKSRILRQIADFHEISVSSEVTVIPCITNAVYDRFKFSPSSKVIYLGSRSVGNAIFYAAIDRHLAKLLFLGVVNQSTFLATLFKTLKMKFSFEIKINRRFAASKSLEHLVDKRKLKRQPIQELFGPIHTNWLIKNAGKPIPLESLEPKHAKLLLRFLELNPSMALTIHRQQQEFEFSALSSGEQNRILLATKILGYAQPKSLIIIDEPEISLHLQWQVEFHGLLVDLLKKMRNFHVVIATHSPVIVAEAAKDSRSADSIVVLGTDLSTDQKITFKRFSSNKITSYDDLVIDSFDTVTYNSHSVSEKIADSLIEIAGDSLKTIAQIDVLNDLKTKVGITTHDLDNIDNALTLINRYYPEKIYEISE